MNPFTEKTSKILMGIGILFFVIGLILFLWNNLSFDTHQRIDSSKFGQFGDFIGGLIGSLWAFAGVILFYVALSEQREDIRINRETLKAQVQALEQQIREFELQRDELELTRKVFIDQSETLKLQQFESTFFNSMNLLNNIINSITYVVDSESRKYGPKENKTVMEFSMRTEIIHGRDCFEYFYNELKEEYIKLITKYALENLKETYRPNADFEIPLEIKTDFANKGFHNFFRKEHSDLGHYFRTLYNIVKFVNEKKPNNPKYYTNLLRSQFSTYEHLLLFYNCHSNFGNEKFRPLIIQYSILDNMSISGLLDKDHELFYPEQAYK